MCLRLAIAYMSGYESYPLIFMWSEEVTMGLLELFLLAIGLSMDAFAVSVCKGLAMQKVNFRSAAHLRRVVRRLSGADALHRLSAGRGV